MLARKGKLTRPIDFAFHKYGVDAFDFRDLMANVPDEMLDPLEKFFIAHFKSADGKHGYNADKGGQETRELGEETKEKLRKHGVVSSEWIHPEHGEFVGGISELARAFPEQKLKVSALCQVRIGRTSNHKGWKSKDPRKKFSSRLNRVHLWWSPWHGELLASCRGVADFSGKKAANSFSYLVGPKAKRAVSYGWRWKCTPSEEHTSRVLPEGKAWILLSEV